jgi:DNA-binding XRE family transcriptional regulator
VAVVVAESFEKTEKRSITSQGVNYINLLLKKLVGVHRQQTNVIEYGPSFDSLSVAIAISKQELVDIRLDQVYYPLLHIDGIYKSDVQLVLRFEDVLKSPKKMLNNFLICTRGNPDIEENSHHVGRMQILFTKLVEGILVLER